MEWSWSGVFEVYSVGDGLFMQRVLQAVAALSNSGVLASLGAMGLLVGLILMGLRAASSGGRQFDLGPLLMSLILCILMFGGRADVIIHDVGLSPGENGQNTYTVDRVPFGVALLGSVISFVGVELTERMEQAYGSFNEVESVREVGFGRSLDWLAAVRFAKQTDTNTSSTAFQRYRRNLVYYMRYCSAQALVREPHRAPRVMIQADPLNTTDGFGFTSSWVTTPWIPAAGVEEEVTCSTALTRLQAYKAGGTAFRDFAHAVAGPMGFSGTGSVENQGYDAFAALNLSADAAQDYMLAAVTNAAWRDALVDMPIIGSQQTMHALMTTQAVQQRATEFAAEESMFRRMMRPLMAFLESMVYAVAPFMALAVGFGSFGITMIGRYCLITAWVALWMPTLAIINMFQLTMADRAIAAVMGPPGGGSGYAISSLAGSAKVEEVVIDWIGTGALLAASTPMITLMLLFGSAMTAVGLANALKGGDVIDQKAASPDAVKNGPAVDHGSAYSYSRAGGTIERGASMPSLEFGRSAETARESALGELSASSSRAEQKLGKEISNALTSDMSRGVGVSSKGEVRQSQAEQRASSAIGERVEGWESIGTAGQRLMMATAMSQNLGASLDVGKATKAIAAGLGGMVEKMGGGKEAQEHLKKLGEALNLGMGGQLSTNDMVDRVSERMARMTEGLRAQMRIDQGLRAEVMGAGIEAVDETARAGAGESSRVAGTSAFAEVRDDMKQKSDSYRDSAKMAERAGTSQRVPLNEVANAIASKGYLPAAEQAAMEYGSPQALATARQNLVASGKFGSMEENGNQIRAAAAALVLSDDVPGLEQPMNAAMQPDRAKALMGLLYESGAVNSGSGYTPATEGGAASERNRGVAGDMDRGQVEQAVQNAQPGAGPGTEAKVRAAQTNTASEQGRAELANSLGNDLGVNVGEIEAKRAEAEGNSEGGQVTFASQRSAAGKLDNAHEDNTDAVRTLGASTVVAKTAQMEADNDALAPAGEGVTGMTMGHGLSRALGEPLPPTAGGGGALDTDALLNLAEAPAQPATSSIPLYDWGDLKQNASDGGYTLGVSLSPAAATVIAGMAAENRGTPLSAGEREEVKEAFESLSPDQQQAVRNIDSKWEVGESQPSVVPPASANALSASNPATSASTYSTTGTAAKISNVTIGSLIQSGTDTQGITDID